MLKNYTWWQKILFVITIMVSVLHLFSFLLPYIAPRKSSLASLSLFTPILLIINIVFCFFWFFVRKKILIVCFVIFLCSLPFWGRFFQVSGKNISSEEDISLMSFNVRIFNHFKWHSDKELNKKIVDFIKEKHPDIIAIQEFHKKEKNSFPFYKHQKILYKNTSNNIGMAILSDYPIIHSGSLNFPNTSNNGIFADIVTPSDTLRVYSLHLESFRINPEEEEIFSQENSEELAKKLRKRFEIQQAQLEIFKKHRETSPYKTIVCGDFNNTAFSYLYREMKSDIYNDSFEQCGSGFGKTYHYKFFPFRIDYILVDKAYTITSHNTFSDIVFSDHYPILTTFRK